MKIVRTRLLIACLLSLLPSVSQAEFPTAELHSLSQTVIQRGTTVTIQPVGKHLEETRSLVVENSKLQVKAIMSAARALDDQRKPTGQFSVTAALGATKGLTEVRTLGRFGISNPRRLLITESPVIALHQPHTDRITAIELPTRTIHTGEFKARQRNYYRVNLEKGDTLHCVVYAQQIDSQAVPQVVLQDPQQRELVRGRAFGPWPAEIQYRCEQSGEYLLVVHDFLYQGGSGFHYAIESAVAAKSESKSILELDSLLRPSLFGETQKKNESILAQESILKSSDSTGDLPFRWYGSLSSGSVNARFEVTQTKPLWFEVKSASAQQLTDPQLLIFQTPQESAVSSKRLFEQDDPPTLGVSEMRLIRRDPLFAWTPPKPGKYIARLMDLERGSARPADAMAYELEIREPNPGFRIIAYHAFPNLNREAARPMGSRLLRGGTIAIRVVAVREDGFNGPIELRCDSLPEGVTASPALIPAGKSDGTIVLSARPDCPSISTKLNITGNALVAGETKKVAAQFSTVTAAKTPRRNAIESRTADDLYVHVGEEDLSPFAVELRDSSPLKVEAGKSLSIPIQLTRRDGGKVVCLLRGQNLPPNSSMADVNVAADKSEAKIELKTQNNTPAGKYTIWLLNEAKIKWNPNPQAIRRAEEYLQRLNEAIAESVDADEKSKLQKALDDHKKQVEELKKRYAPQDLTVWMPSTTARIQVAKPSKESAN